MTLSWSSMANVVVRACLQGLTLVHFLAQPEPFLTQKHTPNTPNTPFHPHTTP